MKKTLLTLALLTAALAMTACSTATDMVTATNTPVPTTSASDFPMQLPTETGMTPQTTGMLPDVQDGMNEMLEGMTGQPTAIPEAAGVTSMDKARRVMEQIEDELERLSEVDDAQVVLAGNKAAVALEFDDQYQGGVDDRLRGIVKERIDSVISGVTTIAITSDKTIMDALETLGERLETMSDMSALQDDLDAIIRQIEGT